MCALHDRFLWDTCAACVVIAEWKRQAALHEVVRDTTHPCHSCNFTCHANLGSTQPYRTRYTGRVIPITWSCQCPHNDTAKCMQSFWTLHSAQAGDQHARNHVCKRPHSHIHPQTLAHVRQPPFKQPVTRPSGASALGGVFSKGQGARVRQPRNPGPPHTNLHLMFT